MSSEIRAFFERYRDAFNALDGDGVARLYAVPSGIASDSGYEHWWPVLLCTAYGERRFDAPHPDPLPQAGEGGNPPC